MKLPTIAPCSLLVSGALALVATSAQAVELSRKPFGKIPAGEAVEAITLTNAKGVSATVITYGATLQALVAPGRDGKHADIALGFSDAETYAKTASYFGATVGRVANRIGKGRFTLDGKTYQLALNNNGVAALHGGVKGFDKVIWTVLDAKSGPVASVTLGYVSPDGDEGYPGTLTTTATYALDEQNQLTITYSATTDKPTIVNISNHALFNMAGEGAAEGAMGNVLTLPADGYSPVDAELIPTGETTPVRHFVEWAFADVGITLRWHGEGVAEKGYCDRSGDCRVEIDQRYFRPTEVDLLIGDPRKAKQKLGWAHETSVRELAREMVLADLDAMKTAPIAHHA